MVIIPLTMIMILMLMITNTHKHNIPCKIHGAQAHWGHLNILYCA